jgi:threonine dehydrogenase-like Zn-dependent dehydrogenase
MKQVFGRGGEIVVLDVPEPEVEPGRVLVDTSFSVISSGTEKGLIVEASENPELETELGPSRKSKPKLRSRPAPGPGTVRVLPTGVQVHGYSSAGTVVAVGAGIDDIQPGDRVACSGMQCAFHAERVSVPRNLVSPVPDGVSLEAAAFSTLGSISMNALRRANVQFGESVVMYGLGLLGQICLQIARGAGMRVIGVDIDPDRVAMALRRGAHAAFDPRAVPDPVGRVRELTDGFGADAVLLFVATPSDEPLNLALQMTRQRGSVVGVGVFGTRFERDFWSGPQIRLVPSQAYGPGRYDDSYEEEGVDYPIGYVRWTENRNQAEFLRLLAEGTVTVDELAPIRLPVTEAPAAYDLLHRPGRPPTVMLTYGRD